MRVPHLAGAYTRARTTAECRHTGHGHGNFPDHAKLYRPVTINDAWFFGTFGCLIN